MLYDFIYRWFLEQLDLQRRKQNSGCQGLRKGDGDLRLQFVDCGVDGDEDDKIEVRFLRMGLRIRIQKFFYLGRWGEDVGGRKEFLRRGLQFSRFRSSILFIVRKEGLGSRVEFWQGRCLGRGWELQFWEVRVRWLSSIEFLFRLDFFYIFFKFCGLGVGRGDKLCSRYYGLVDRGQVVFFCREDMIVIVREVEFISVYQVLG